MSSGWFGERRREIREGLSKDSSFSPTTFFLFSWRVIEGPIGFGGADSRSKLEATEAGSFVHFFRPFLDVYSSVTTVTTTIKWYSNGEFFNVFFFSLRFHLLTAFLLRPSIIPRRNRRRRELHPFRVWVDTKIVGTNRTNRPLFSSIALFSA